MFIFLLWIIPRITVQFTGKPYGKGAIVSFIPCQSMQVRWLNWEGRNSVQRIALILLVLLLMKYLLDKPTVLPPKPIRPFFSLPQWVTVVEQVWNINRKELSCVGHPFLFLWHQKQHNATKRGKPREHYCNKATLLCPISWIFFKIFILNPEENLITDCSLSTLAVCYHLKWCKYQNY